MISLVDTHTHIHAALAGLDETDHTTKKWHDAGESDPDSMIKLAANAGVSKLVCVGTTLADSKVAVDFAANRSNCWASVGIHPHDAKENVEDLQTKLRGLASQPKVVAIGECGLDYFYEHSPRTAQLVLLEKQLQIAQDAGLPVIFHIREAFEDFWPLLDNFQGLSGVLHSFTANMAQMERGLNKGLFVGLNGIMTFTKDPEQITMAKSVPLKNLLLETDAPYLTPKPFRGKICKSEYVRLTAEFLAELRGETLEQMAEQTTSNAHKLFKLN